MSDWYTDDVRELFEAVLSLRDAEECRGFFQDVCTVKELIEMSQRLKVAKLLDGGANYTAINRETGVSTATISRVSRCLDYGSGGYKTVIGRLKKERET